MSESEEVEGSAIVSGGDAAEAFEPIEASFDAIAMPVGFSIVGNGDLPCPVGGDTILACMAAIVWRNAILR